MEKITRSYFNCIMLMMLYSSAHAQYRFVLTGGPGIGKTTVINLLKEEGYQTVPESWTLLFNQAKESNTLDAFSKEDPAAFRERLMDFQLSLENAIDAKKTAILDRSTVDVVAFGQRHNVGMAQRLLDIPKKDRYDLIFFLDPLPKELYDKPKELFCTREQSLEIHEFLKKAYTDMGFLIIDVPFDTPVKRMAFILEAIRTFK